MTLSTETATTPLQVSDGDDDDNNDDDIGNDNDNDRRPHIDQQHRRLIGVDLPHFHEPIVLRLDDDLLSDLTAGKEAGRAREADVVRPHVSKMCVCVVQYTR